MDSFFFLFFFLLERLDPFVNPLLAANEISNHHRAADSIGSRDCLVVKEQSRRNFRAKIGFNVEKEGGGGSGVCLNANRSFRLIKWIPSEPIRSRVQRVRKRKKEKVSQRGEKIGVCHYDPVNIVNEIWEKKTQVTSLVTCTRVRTTGIEFSRNRAECK